MVELGEVIASLTAQSASLKIISANHPDSFIRAVSRQQFVAEAKECRIGKSIVFKNNAFLFVLKEPGDGPAYGPGTTKVVIAEKSLELARPVDCRE